MGLERTVTFPAAVPEWDAIRTQLTRVGETGPLRMIDGLPAFPDEIPAPGWAEVRLAAAGAMVTVRRSGQTLACVVWSSADPELLAARDRVAWACAAAGSGAVRTDTGTVTADEFAQQSGIRPA